MKKVVLITGGSRGIGAECVRKFASKNYNVVFTYKNSEEKAQKLAADLKNEYKGCEVLPIKADVASFEEMQNVGNFICSIFGKIDVLVCNAGVAKIAPIIDVSNQDYENIMNTNLKGTFNAVKCAVPSMIKNMYGKIVIISSIWGIEGSSCESIYSASKAGQIGLMKSLAKELGPSNITVNSVAPGLIDTEMNNDLTPEDKQCIIDETPLVRIGNCLDVANSVYFLASDEASFITGETIKVSGGW